jgi:hypothetical protein
MSRKPPRGRPPSQRGHRRGLGVLTATAYHEAGHAVANLVLGFDVIFVDIRQREIQGAYSEGITNGGHVKNEMLLAKAEELERQP